MPGAYCNPNLSSFYRDGSKTQAKMEAFAEEPCSQDKGVSENVLVPLGKG